MEIDYETLTDYAGADGYTLFVYQGYMPLFGDMYLDRYEYFYPIWTRDNSLSE